MYLVKWLRRNLNSGLSEYSLTSCQWPQAKASPLSLRTSTSSHGAFTSLFFIETVSSVTGVSTCPKKNEQRETQAWQGWVCEEEEICPFNAKSWDKTSANLQAEVICDRNEKSFFSLQTALHLAERMDNAPDQRIFLTLFILMQSLFFKPGTVFSLTQPGNLTINRSSWT